MSDYAGGDADRDAFFAALGRVFEEFRNVSKGYAICDLTRSARTVGGDMENQVGISRTESGRIVTEFSDSSFFPDLTEDKCWVWVPSIGPDGLMEMECIMYLTS